MALAFGGDRYGHMDVVGYDGYFEVRDINPKRILHYSYTIIAQPANRTGSGTRNKNRFLKACYLPADDTKKVAQSL